MLVSILIPVALGAPTSAFGPDGDDPQFGSAKVLRQPPSPECTKRPAPGVRWSCPVSLEGVQGLVANLMVTHGRWTGVFVEGVVTSLDAAVVAESLAERWGTPFGGDAGDLLWHMDDRIGVFHQQEAGVDLYEVHIVYASIDELRRSGVDLE